MQYIMRD